MARHRHDPSKDLVGFLVGDVMYAVRIVVVREILNPLPVVALPRAPGTVRGVADYRGDVVPVIDLRDRFGLNVRVMYPAADLEPNVWQTNTEACCAARKVEPMNRALAGRDAWVTGLRRSDSPSRRTTPSGARTCPPPCLGSRSWRSRSPSHGRSCGASHPSSGRR